MKIYQYNAGHMTKMAAMPIYGKAHFQGTTCTELILMKLCSKHQIPKRFIFCSNFDHGLTLTYFIARLNLQFRLLYVKM